MMQNRNKNKQKIEIYKLSILLKFYLKKWPILNFDFL